MDNQVLIPILISTLAGLSTLIGGLVVFIKFKNKEKFITFALSFSLSVMISISVFDLIPESFKTLIENYTFLWSVVITIISFLFGHFLVKIINKKTSTLPENNLYRVGVLSMIALMAHNFPEGIATFMASYNDIHSGISLAIAIMMHNIPEGISISVPISYSTGSKKRGVLYSFLSGLAEPIGAILSFIILKKYINNITISIVLIIVAGIMITLSINEMLPEALKYNKKREINLGLILGLIMVLINLYLF